MWFGKGGRDHPKFLWFGKGGRGHPKFLGTLCTHSFKRIPLLKFLDPPLTCILVCTVFSETINGSICMHAKFSRQLASPLQHILNVLQLIVDFRCDILSNLNIHQITIYFSLSGKGILREPIITRLCLTSIAFWVVILHPSIDVSSMGASLPFSSCSTSMLQSSFNVTVSFGPEMNCLLPYSRRSFCKYSCTNRVTGF